MLDDLSFLIVYPLNVHMLTVRLSIMYRNIQQLATAIHAPYAQILGIVLTQLSQYNHVFQQAEAFKCCNRELGSTS